MTRVYTELQQAKKVQTDWKKAFQEAIGKDKNSRDRKRGTPRSSIHTRRSSIEHLTWEASIEFG